MAYKRNLSKKCNSWIWVGTLAFFGVIISGSITDGCWAAFASNYSMSVGEQYTDNVFFTKDKSGDFITVITPTLNLLYAPQGETVPTVNLSISPQAQIFAHNSDLNNFGRRMSMSASYTEPLTPRLSVHFSDGLSRDGVSRAGGLGGGGLLCSPTGTGCGVPSAPNSQNLQNFTSVGDVVTNYVSARGTFLYQPNMSFSADYTNTFTKFLSEGGSDIYNTIGARGVYNWRQEHNFHAGYYISVYNSRNGDNSVIHNFDFGDDYFSNVQVRLSPTLTIALSTGASFNTGNGPRIANNTNLTITKLWETATLQGGVRKGLTPSFGVSGISDTTSFFTDFDSRITERLTAKANVSYSLWNTDNENFKTFQAIASLQYAINSWLSSNLSYAFYSTNGGSGGTANCSSSSSNTTCIPKGTVNANTVFLSLTANFNLWPNPGLSRGISSSAAVPIVRPPFASGQAPAGGTATP